MYNGFRIDGFCMIVWQLGYLQNGLKVIDYIIYS